MKHEIVEKNLGLMIVLIMFHLWRWRKDSMLSEPERTNDA